MTVRVPAALILLVASGANAQEPQRRDIEVVDLRAAQAALAVPEPPDPPAGTEAWTLLVDTTGGFAGRGVGSVTITSNGQMTCGPAPCATPVGIGLLKPVATTLASIVDAAWIRLPPSSVCRDCIQTTIALKRRGGDGVRSYVASWDDSQAIAPELRELRRVALELRAARAGR